MIRFTEVQVWGMGRWKRNGLRVLMSFELSVVSCEGGPEPGLKELRAMSA
jgi:hypothetical protein